MNDADSLEHTIREENTPTSLPVITLGRAERLRERAYRERCVVRLIEIGLESSTWARDGFSFRSEDAEQSLAGDAQ